MATALAHTKYLLRATAATFRSPFVPTDIPGLAAWYDFSDASTLYTDAGTTLVTADGQSIHQVNDKSGNARHALQTAGAAKPTYKTAIQNGLSVARFDGVNDALMTANTTLSGLAATAFYVARLGASAAANRSLGNYGYNVRSELYWNHRVTDVSGGTNGNIGVAQMTSPNALVVDEALIAVVTLDYGLAAAEAQVHKNGVPFTTRSHDSNNTTGFAAAQRFEIGAAGAGNLWLGDYYEYIVFDTALSDTNRNRVGNYLAAKWGLTWTGA